MRSQADRDESAERREDSNGRRVKDVTSATTSSLPSTAIPSGKSGTELHDGSRSAHTQSTRPLSEDRASDDLLHSPILPSGPQPHTIVTELPAPVEAAVWDWQAPTFGAHRQPETSDPASAYFYEPQGELLLHTPTEPVSVRAEEFSIPGPVVSPVDHRPLTNPLESSSTSGTGSARVGTKRKPSADLNEAAAKRSTLDMVESDRAGDRMTAQSGKTTPILERRNPLASHPTTSTSHMVLPARKVFPIQIGDKLFRLSGASISSDAPSYFSQFFEEQLRQCSPSNGHNKTDASSVRTLYIDRDPSTFCDISLHLQGYHIEPRDGAHFVKLFADAQFFSLPRLTSQLFSSPIYTTIGSVPFQIPRDLFSASPGNEPNYFTLGFQIFFTTPSDAFPGLSQRTLLRPPSLLPPAVPNRDAGVFADLLCMLKGYEVEIRSDEHRQNLLRDARYFNFRGLEQRLIRHRVYYDPRKEREEIVIRLEDIRQSGISFVAEEDIAGSEVRANPRGEIYYARPYVDDEPRGLILEIGDTDGVEVLLDVGSKIGGVGFRRQTAARTRRLAGIINEKVGLAALTVRDEKAIEDGVPKTFGLRCEIGSEADVSIDGERWKASREDEEAAMDVEEDEDRERLWALKKSQWRVKLGSLDSRKIYLEAVKLEGCSRERTKAEGRDFL